MKKLAAIALSAVLLTGCSATPSEEWLAAKHECVVAGWEVKEDNPKMTHSEIEKHCIGIADRKLEK